MKLFISLTKIKYDQKYILCQTWDFGKSKFPESIFWFWCQRWNIGVNDHKKILILHIQYSKKHLILHIKMRLYIYKNKHACNENSISIFWWNIEQCSISILYHFDQSTTYFMIKSSHNTLYIIMNLKWKYKKEKYKIFNCFMSHGWVVRSFCSMKWPLWKIQPWSIGRVNNKIDRKLTLNWVDHRTDIHDKNVVFISFQRKITRVINTRKDFKKLSIDCSARSAVEPPKRHYNPCSIGRVNELSNSDFALSNERWPIPISRA